MIWLRLLSQDLDLMIYNFNFVTHLSPWLSMHQNQFSFSVPSFKASHSPQSTTNLPNLMAFIKLTKLATAAFKTGSRWMRNEHQQSPYVWPRFPS